MPLAIRRGVCAAILAFGLSACATTPDPIYYLLPTPQLSAGAPYGGGTIAVREIALPLYARAQQVASLAEDGSVFLSDDHRWADEPARASTRAFVAAIKQLSGASVVAEPWPIGTSPSLRIDIAVDRFIGDLRGGDLEFSGQYRVVGAGGGLGDQDTFAYRIPIDGEGYKPLAKAHSDAIAKLAEDIVGRIGGGS